MGRNNNKFNLERYKCLKLDALELDETDLYFRDLKNTSIGFNTGAKEKAADFFFKKFKLSDENQFKEKFMESVSGDGDELSKNDALHSSSLCALLCFYNVKNNHLEYEGVMYDDVFFEFKNKVESRPSNMDVVLTGKDSNGKTAIMFVECKFSEFIGSGKYKLGEAYHKEPYKHIFDNFNYDSQNVFQYGLKQLVAHYTGIKNFVIGDINKYKRQMSKYYREKDNRIDLYRKFDYVSFIEVIFDFPNNQDCIDYKKETEQVFNVLEAERKKDKLDINLLGTITYQYLFREYDNGKNASVLDDKVRDFYKLN